MIQDSQFNTLIEMLQQIATPLNGFQNILDNIDQANEFSEIQIVAIVSILESQAQLCAIYHLDRINLINMLKKNMIQQRRNLKERKIFNGPGLISMVTYSHNRKEGVAIINEKGEYIFLDSLARSILGIRKSKAFDITIHHKLTHQSLIRLKQFFDSRFQTNFTQEIELELIISNKKSQKKYSKQIEKEIKRNDTQQAQTLLNSAETVKSTELTNQNQTIEFKTVLFRFSRIDCILSEEFIEAIKATDILFSPKVQFKQVIQGVLLKVLETIPQPLSEHEQLKRGNNIKLNQINKKQKTIKAFGE